MTFRGVCIRNNKTKTIYASLTNVNAVKTTFFSRKYFVITISELVQ